MKTPEGYEKADIDKYLKWIRAYVVKPATSGFGESGHSDRVVCIDGWFVSIEVKRADKDGVSLEPTPLQWWRIHECEAAGGKAFWGTAKKVLPEMFRWRHRIG